MGISINKNSIVLAVNLVSFNLHVLLNGFTLSSVNFIRAPHFTAGFTKFEPRVKIRRCCAFGLLPLSYCSVIH